MDTHAIIYVSIAVFSAIIGVYLIFIKHIWRHPAGDEIVKKDVCESEKKGMRDCIEGAITLAKMQYEVLVKKLDELTEEVRSMNGKK